MRPNPVEHGNVVSRSRVSRAAADHSGKSRATCHAFRAAASSRVFIAAALAALAACKSKPKEASAPPPPIGPAPAAATTELPDPVSARPHLMHSNDIEGIRHFLQTVDTVKGAKFDVTWAPGTVTLDRATTIRSLRGISEDGATLQFDASEAKLKDLKPGVVLLAWGTALRRVSAVNQQADTLVVQTVPVPLDSAIVGGSIEWQTDVLPTQEGFVTRTLPSPGHPAPPGRTGMLPIADGIRARYAAFHPLDVEAGGSNEPPNPPEQGAAPPPPGLPDAPEVQPPEEDPEHEFEGELGFYVYKIGFGSAKPGVVNLSLDIFRTDASQSSGTREEKSKQAIEKNNEAPKYKNESSLGKPYQSLKPSDLLDLRVNAKAHIASGVSTGTMTFKDGKGTAHFTNNLSGYANFKLIARVGTTPQFMEKFRLTLPISYNVPLIIGGIPFMVTFSAAVIVRPALSSRYATATGEYYVRFGGSEGVTAGHGNVSGDGTITDTDSGISGGDFTGVGISALQVSLQLPKLGLGVGLLNTGVITYVDQVVTGSMVTEGAGGIALVPCKEWSMNIVWSAGSAALFLGSMLYDSKQPIWTLNPVFHKSEPPGLNCHALG
jgi:hypothetical protein